MKYFLVLVDFQAGFLTSENARYANSNVDTLLKLDLFDKTAAAKYFNPKNSNILKLTGYTDMTSEEETSIIGEAANADFVFEKHNYSAYTEDLLQWMKDQNENLPETVFIAGLDTECCVLATALDFFENGIRPIVLADYCGSSLGESRYEAGILSLESLIGTNNIFHGTVSSREQLSDIVEKSTLSKSNNVTDAKQNKAVLVEILKQKGYHIAFAESCTGGRAAAGIVDVPNASNVLNCSYVTYSNESKMRLLGVSEQTIENCGAVSEETAFEMAKGVASNTGAEVGVGITGLAGPTGGSKRKPVGTVCFGFCINGEVTTYKKCFGNIGRSAVRNASVSFVFDTLIDLLK